MANGQAVFVKFAGDGFELAKRDVATAHTITVSNEEKALQIATISLVHASEKYQVNAIADQEFVSLDLFSFSVSSTHFYQLVRKKQDCQAPGHHLSAIDRQTKRRTNCKSVT